MMTTNNIRVNDWVIFVYNIRQMYTTQYDINYGIWYIIIIPERSQ